LQVDFCISVRVGERADPSEAQVAAERTTVAALSSRFRIIPVRLTEILESFIHRYGVFSWLNDNGCRLLRSTKKSHLCVDLALQFDFCIRVPGG
jgi:hypothetical protein